MYKLIDQNFRKNKLRMERIVYREVDVWIDLEMG